MTDIEAFFESPTGTREELMRATFLALCEHGYSDLTVDRIAEVFPKSKALIYHHFESKDDLLLALLEYLLARYEEAIPHQEYDDPWAHLEAILEHGLPDAPKTDPAFVGAMVELRAQAVTDETFRDHFTRSDRFFQDRIASVIESGIEMGRFHPVDADRVAALVLTVITGAITRRVTTGGDSSTAAIRAALRDSIEAHLLVEAR